MNYMLFSLTPSLYSNNVRTQLILSIKINTNLYNSIPFYIKFYETYSNSHTAYSLVLLSLLKRLRRNDYGRMQIEITLLSMMLIADPTAA